MRRPLDEAGAEGGEPDAQQKRRVGPAAMQPGRDQRGEDDVEAREKRRDRRRDPLEAEHLQEEAGEQEDAEDRAPAPRAGVEPTTSARPQREDRRRDRE